MSLEKVIMGAVQNAEANAKIDRQDFTKDGLLHCGKCGGQKQCKVSFLGKEMTVFCVCECRQEELRKEEEAREAEKQLERIKRLRANSLQDKALQSCTFAKDDGSNQKLQGWARNYVDSWADNYRDNIGFLLWGDTGTGKTFYAACIANALLDKGVPVLITSFGKIINALSGFEIQDKNAYIDSLNSYKLLVIDDLGAERQSDFALEQVFAVIDGRYKSGKPVIVTTNLTLEQIRSPKDMQYRRIYDRLLEMCTPILFDGENKRQRIARGKMGSAKRLLE